MEKKIAGLVPSVVIGSDEPKKQVIVHLGKGAKKFEMLDPNLVEYMKGMLEIREMPDDVDFYPITGIVDTHLMPFGEHCLHPFESRTNPYDDTDGALCDQIYEKVGSSSLPDHNYAAEPLTANALQTAVLGPEKAVEMVLATPAGPFVKAILSDGGLSVPEMGDALEELFFVRREWCEKDKNWLQLLPYIVFFKWVEGRLKIFVYQRGKGVGEERLAGNYSVGVGGHVNPQDRVDTFGPSKWPGSVGDTLIDHGLWRALQRNIVREVGEEVIFEDADGTGMSLNDIPKFHGLGTPFYKLSGPLERMAMFLDYSASDVEKVHLGVFIGIEVPAGWDVRTNEEELVDVGFMDVQDIYDNLDAYSHNGAETKSFECWTQSIIRSIVETQKFVTEHEHEKVEVSLSEGEPSFKEFHFDTIARHVPRLDRWKIGTLSRIISKDLDIYQTNVFMKV